MRSLHGIGVDPRARLAPEGEVQRPHAAAEMKRDPFLPSPDLPLGQKIVLLKLRRGDTAAAILQKLKAMSAPEPSKSDWIACIEARLIRRNFATCNTGRLELLPPGLSFANAIMRDLAPKYGVHLWQRSGGKGSGLKAACSCQYQTPFCNDSRAGESKLNSLMSAHMRDVESGTWDKRRQSLTVFLNEVAAPRLPLEARNG